MVFFLILFSLKINKISDDSKTVFKMVFSKIKNKYRILSGKTILIKMRCPQNDDSNRDRFRWSSLNTS